MGNEGNYDPWTGHRWWFRIKLATVTGILALILARITGFQFSFLWYIALIVFWLLVGAGWAAMELWKDYGPKRN